MADDHKPPAQMHQSYSDHAADIRWVEGKHPLCQRFDDYYFSSDNGLAETQHNFIQPSALPERFAQMSENSVLRVAETGFGTGLNFLALWQAWQTYRHAGTLEFYSVEKYPLNQRQLQQALAAWPELAPLAAQLCQAYPSLTTPGWHRLDFAHLRLHLFIGDVGLGLAELQQHDHPRFLRHNRCIDAWFLDGFAPAKNPEMWHDNILSAIANLSRDGATVATFTAASAVRKKLLALGFTMQKGSGYGLKREMMAGTFGAPADELSKERPALWPTSPHNSLHLAPWALNLERCARAQSVVIIGGGIAACCNARALADAGFNVQMLERHNALAQEGSGNPQGVLYAKLSHRAENLSRFNLLALHYAQNFYRHLADSTDAQISLCGAVQLAGTPKQVENQQKLIESLQAHGDNTNFIQQLDHQALSQLAGLTLERSGLYFPKAGWLNPASVCQALCQHPNITVQHQREVDAIERNGGQWQCLDAKQQLLACADIIVIANANDARRFSQTQTLPLKAVRGQVSYAAATAASAKLNTVVCGQGYIAPAHEQQHCLGASFNLSDDSLTLSRAEQQHNFEHLQADFPAMHDALQADQDLRGRVARRCTSPDYLPLIGPVPDAAPMQTRFALLARNAKAAIAEPGCYYPNLYISVAFGSRGLCYAPLAAAELTSQIQGSPSPLGKTLRQALNPARFLIRDMIRRKHNR